MSDGKAAISKGSIVTVSLFFKSQIFHAMKNAIIVLLLLLLKVQIFAQAPDFAWAKKAGGALDDWGSGIAVDPSGNSYVIGRFEDTASFDSSTLFSSGYSDIFIAKYDASGNVLWARQAGGANSDFGLSIALDGSGNSYVTGFFLDTARFGGTTFISSGIGMFVVKYDALGNVVWARSPTGSGSVGGQDISVDGSGNCFIIGGFSGTIAFGASTLTTLTGSGTFIVKYDGSGNVIWAKQAGGIAEVSGWGIGVDGSGNSYITGDFEGAATFGSTTLTSYASNDIYIAKYDAVGNVLWAKSVNGAGTDYGSDISVDASGNSYITGSFYGTASFGSITLNNGSRGAFIAKYDAAGNVVWANQVIGSSVYGWGIVKDNSGHSYVTGMFHNNADFGGATLTSSGEAAFIAKYDAAGNVVWAKSPIGSGYSRGHSIAVDGSGNCFINGIFRYDQAFGSTMLSNNGNTDMFIARIGTYTGITEELTANFIAWPNPFSVSLQLQLPKGAGGPATASLTDLLGREVHRQQVTAAATICTVTPPAALPAGLYLLRVVQGTEVQQVRVVRE